MPSTKGYYFYRNPKRGGYDQRAFPKRNLGSAITCAATKLDNDFDPTAIGAYYKVIAVQRSLG